MGEKIWRAPKAQCLLVKTHLGAAPSQPEIHGLGPIATPREGAKSSYVTGLRFFRRWRLREAFGVRGACSRFRVSNHQRKRQQAGRTPYASRGSVAVVPAVLRCAVSPISNRQAWKCPDRGASREVPQAGSPAIQQIGNRLEICATLTFSTRLRCAPSAAMALLFSWPFSKWRNVFGLTRFN